VFVGESVSVFEFVFEGGERAGWARLACSHAIRAVQLRRMGDGIDKADG
jgi:hypothetical protein